MNSERYKFLLILLREMRTVLQKLYTEEFTEDAEINTSAGSIEYHVDRIKIRAGEITK